MPYPIKVDHDFSKQWHKRNLWNFLFAAIGFGTVAMDIWGHAVPKVTVWTAIGIASFIFAIFRWMLQDIKILNNYHCPTCGLHLEGPLIRDLGPEIKEAYTFD